MSALLTEEQVLTVEETTPVLPDAELELLWFEALVEDDYRKAWSEALAYDRTRNASLQWSANWNARQEEWQLANEKALADPTQRLASYECEALMKRLKKRKRLAA